jgi:NADH dehydrogenase FAD-containing subunit
VKVKPTLQLANHARIFALGDIIDWKQEKQAAKMPGHVTIVTNNILALVGVKPSLKSYKGAIEMIGVSNGKVCFCLAIFCSRGSLKCLYL